MRNIILVTGTPGVGKTTLASNLSQRLGYKLVEPNNVVKKERLYTRIDKAKKTHIVDEKKLRKRLTELSRSREGIVIPTHLITGVIPEPSVKIALVLRLDPAILFRRLWKRGWTRTKALENTEAEILDVCLIESISVLGARRVCEINTTRKSAPAVFREALRALKGTGTRSVHVNWLAHYDPLELGRSL